MKKFKTTMLLVLLLLAPIFTYAQDMYVIQEDIVKLSKVKEYEALVKEFVTLTKKHNLQDVSWITLSTNTSHYLYISPIKNMAALDEESYGAKLAAKAGKDVVSNLYKRADQYTETELSYIVHLDKELTYMPNGFTQTPAGKNFRKQHLLYVSPENRAIVKEKMKAVKALFERKGSKEYYRVYRSGFGTVGDYYLVAIAAVDELDYARQSKENDALLGEEGKKVLGDLFSSLLKYEVVLGNIRPEFSYSPK
ncbi:MAG TPA: hypothetical protein ENK46_12460 [Flavobacteriia bacterium]|nr:hypothetical protein [Flavobacteriia bacterium]